MTNTPKPQANGLDEILSILEGNRIDMSRHKREALAKQQIEALITEARIDEVEGIINMPPDFDDFDVYLPYRLKQLKENK